MTQTRLASLIESIANVLAGIGVAIVAQTLLFPWLWDIHISFQATSEIAMVFTAIAIPRSYLVRRGFEWLREKEILP
jgi:hypothetical protein